MTHASASFEEFTVGINSIKVLERGSLRNEANYLGNVDTEEEYFNLNVWLAALSMHLLAALDGPSSLRSDDIFGLLQRVHSSALSPLNTRS
jgi:hypothetical protein